MIKIDGGYLAVFTKYDSVFTAVNEPYFKHIEANQPMDFNGSMYDYRRYNIDRVEDGLEGVRFIHYI